VTIAGYRVLAADFHSHSSMWSDGALTPWGLVLEAQRQGLDAIAVTAHNELGDARLARWFSRRIGGPTVVVGQEVLAPGHHVIALGIERLVDWHQIVTAQIDEIHRQSGVAVAAHPVRTFWRGFDAEAMARLDGSEICHPLIHVMKNGQRELEQFAGKASLAAIGSSDFHGFGRLGDCRTYVFARENSAPAILAALRAHHTVVYGLDGTAYGDPALIRLAAEHQELREAATTDPPVTWLDWVSRVCGIAGLIGLASLTRYRSRSPAWRD
jgi:hypothetical protein